MLVTVHLQDTAAGHCGYSLSVRRPHPLGNEGSGEGQAALQLRFESTEG